MKKKIAWLVPSLIEGSGGHRTIFQHMQALSINGYDCHVYIGKSQDISNTDEAGNQLKTYFGDINAKVHYGYDLKENFDMVFATAFFTVKHLFRFPEIKYKAYFVQDFEACFFSMGDSYLEAENSYRMGVPAITVGKWLSYRLGKDYGLKSCPVDFCADINTYKPLTNVEKEEKSVCCIFQPEKPRRCAYTALQALNILKTKMPELKVYLYGSNEKSVQKLNSEFVNLELISVKDCNELYNKCSIGLCISSSNPSRIPFEMMAAGLPVVDVYRENNLYDIPSEGTALAECSSEKIAEKMYQLLKDDEKRSQMSKFGVEFMKNRGLEYGFEQFVSYVDSMFKDEFIPCNHYNVLSENLKVEQLS